MKKVRDVLANTLRPAGSGSAVSVAIFALCAVMTVMMCSLQGEKRQLEADRQLLLAQNEQLNSNVNHLNDTVYNVNSLNQAQDDLIATQQEAMAWIEKGLDTIEVEHKAEVDSVAEEKDAAIQQLLNMIDDLDIFESVSRSGAYASAVAQIEKAKQTITGVLGDSDEAAELLGKLDAESERIEDFIEHYPDYYPTSGSLTSPYGWRRDPFTDETAFHNGVDLANSIGTPIYAAASGTVTYVGELSGYGMCILIDHGNGYQTRYAHLSQYLVSVGETVNKTDRIALMGMSGRATGPHLHFEVILNGATQDPMKYIG